MRRPSLLSALVVATVLAACGEGGLLQSVVNPLVLDLIPSSDSMVPGERLAATIVIRNRSAREVQFRGGGCTIGFDVLRPEGSVVPPPSWWACTDEESRWAVPPHDSLVVPDSWSGVSEASGGPRFAVTPLPPGVYHLRPVIHAAEFDLAGPTTAVRVLPCAYARFVHTLPGLPPLDLVVGGRIAASGVAFGNVSSGSLVAVGTQTVELRVAGQGTAVGRANLDFVEGAGTIVLARAGPDGPEPWGLADGAGELDGTMSGLRVIHLAAHVPPITVYRTQPDQPTPTPVMVPFPYGFASPYLVAHAGSWSVLVTSSDGRDTLMRTAAMPIPGGQGRTLILLDESGGGMSGALIDR
jgi:hypothetical protein